MEPKRKVRRSFFGEFCKRSSLVPFYILTALRRQWQKWHETSKRCWETTLRFTGSTGSVPRCEHHTLAPKMGHQDWQRQGPAHCNRGQFKKKKTNPLFFNLNLPKFHHWWPVWIIFLSLIFLCETFLSLFFLCETKCFARASPTWKLPGKVQPKLMEGAGISGSTKPQLPDTSNSFSRNLMASFPRNLGGTGSTSSPRSSSGFSVDLGTPVLEPLLLLVQ